VKENVDHWDESGEIPREFFTKAYKAGVYAPMYPSEIGVSRKDLRSHSPSSYVSGALTCWLRAPRRQVEFTMLSMI
jgi:hypothetical protein